MLHSVIYINQIYAYICKPEIHIKCILMAFPGVEREKVLSCRDKRENEGGKKTCQKRQEA